MRPETLLGEAAPAPPRELNAVSVMSKAATENFPVALQMLPRRLRTHLLAIYGYSRLVDDAGDAVAGDRDAALDWVERELAASFAGAATHPVFVRLQETIVACDLDRQPFLDLLAANRLDQVKSRYATYAELLEYCRLSANPVGRLVLAVFGQLDDARTQLSDDVCSGLQIVEHLQDVAEDFAAGRVYLPSEDLDRFGCTVEELAGSHASPGLRRVVAFEASRARHLLGSGRSLVVSLHGYARLAIAGFVGGGLAQLDAFEHAEFDVLSSTLKASKLTVGRRALGQYAGALTRVAT